MYSGIHISQTDARPMYLQIMEQIRARIAAGDWPPGKELPSIRALAAGSTSASSPSSAPTWTSKPRA
jgi:GntR family transcriptional regulator